MNRAAGLSSGLGILYSLSTLVSPVDGTLFLVPDRNPGFFLGREPSCNPAAAVLLGWVEQERLGWLDAVVANSRMPRLVPGSGLMGAPRDWIIELLGTLEMEGVLSNPEILISHLWR